MPILTRRSFFTHGAALVVAAPAIVKAASLDFLPRGEIVEGCSLIVSAYDCIQSVEETASFLFVDESSSEAVVFTGLLSVDQITREAVRLFKNNNEFLQAMADGPNWPDQKFIRVRLPNDFTVTQTHDLTWKSGK